eukprot:TRINITY_DN5067_c1_g1_i1.p1 TRINITY_DN5067_c1_g1~~TRINITY_DN5067_c1_g1_i1.p1  ORF type:complete len:294 (+),score=103.59 TRINITY_DN5067_c1_g1_i1:59-883(+)
MADKVQIEQRGSVGYVTLNNAKKGNCIPKNGLAQLIAYFTGLKEDKSTRVVVVQSVGSKTFCTGLDLGESAQAFLKWGRKPDAVVHAMDTQLTWGNVIRAMRACPQPIVACIDGLALGGGFALALASDIRVATKHSKMNVQMIKIGLTGCDLGISYFLPRIVGMSHAAHLMYTGEFCDAEKAHRIGLVSELYADAAAMNRGVATLIEQLLETDPFGLRLTKHALSLSVDAPSLEAAMAVEDRQQVMLCASPSFAMNMAKRQQAGKEKAKASAKL